MAKKRKAKSRSKRKSTKRTSKKSSKKSSKRKSKKKSSRKASRPSPLSVPSMARPNKTWAFIGTIPILGYLLCLFDRRRDMYVMYYARQGLALGIAYIVLNILLTLLVVTIPLLFVWNLICLVLWIISARNAFSGRMVPTPVVGRLAAKF